MEQEIVHMVRHIGVQAQKRWKNVKVIHIAKNLLNHHNLLTPIEAKIDKMPFLRNRNYQ